MENAADKEFIECGLAVVHPWLCDAMGHLTTRHYLGMFDDAAYHLFSVFGYYPETAKLEQWGWADVRHTIEYRGELLAGDLIRIDGRVASIGRSSLDLEYRMFNRASNALAANLSARTVCFDLGKRKSKPIPDQIRRGIEGL